MRKNKKRLIIDASLTIELYERLKDWLEEDRSRLSEDERLWLFDFKFYLGGIGSKHRREQLASRAKALLAMAIKMGFQLEPHDRNEQANTSEGEVSGQDRKWLVSEIFNNVDAAESKKPLDFPERRREASAIVQENSSDFIIVRYLVSNSATIEHPIPRIKFESFQQALLQSGSMSVLDAIAKFNFRKNDQPALVALITQAGYTIKGNIIYAQLKKAS